MALVCSHLLVYLLFVPFYTKCDFVGEPDLTKHQIVSPVLEEHKCQRFDEDGLRHLGTKTPYRVVANADETPPAYEGCTPVCIAGVVRHGTRTPGVKDVDRMRTTLGKIKASLFVPDSDLKPLDFHQDNTRGAICQSEKDRIMNWKLTLESEEGKTLTREGKDEMFKLAQRYQRRYPDLLSRTYSNSTFLFKFTLTQRTEQSAKFFTAGLFGKERSGQVWFPEALDKDPILRMKLI
uniref:Multiple inositol polyphosphate phosphatase 1 n=1 Tax=Lygus hesperus TaxID=30085 RepID=A0A146M169_LYGHE